MTQSKQTLVIALVAFLSFFGLTLSAQSSATTTVNSTTGYSVTVKLTPSSVVAPSGCPWGYNYNTRIDYQITFSGSNIPSALYTLQTSLDCNNQGNFTSLPLSGGTGQALTHSNPYRNTTDCRTASFSSLGCNAFNLTIQGPGIATQNIYMPLSTALPVKFISFTSENKEATVQLNWSTGFELNNNFFSVERSTDGTTWTEVTRVESGKIDGVQNYLAIDSKPINGLSFYRIKQVDINGSSSYSEIIVNEYKSPLTVSIFPNPATTEFSVVSENIQNLEIIVLDAQGKTCELSSSSGENTVTFSTEGLSNGVYFIKIML
ncbi:MAG TPA: T9SS type A sorting domain-containing protein, partial [Bacteroidia bacterium]